MRANPYVGRTVALMDCPAYDDENTPIRISGLWEVEEFLACEPAAYIHSDCFWLMQNDRSAVVDAYELIEQIDPKAHAASLVHEREIDEALRDEYAQRVQDEA